MARQRGPNRSPREVEFDQHIGNRLRQARTIAKMSQTELGKGVGITFQQIQKYENGSNRIGGSRLWSVSQFLGLPVSYFYEGLTDTGTKSAAGRLLEDPENLKLLRDFANIKDTKLKLQLRQLVSELSRSPRRVV
jgi:transcriptional regulator with XRE-family HTH domain